MRYDTFDALIFDCDGTLADTMPAHHRAWTTALTPHGLTLDEARFYALGGVPTREIARLLAEEQGVAVDLDAVSAQKEQAYLALAHQARPIAAVIEVARAHRGRLPMAVATGSLRSLATQTLRALGVLDWFDALVAAEDARRPKPAPDPFIEAARRLGVDPARCCAFEDTELGLRSIRAAGMHAIDVRALIADAR